MDQPDSCKPIALASVGSTMGLQSLFRSDGMQKSEAEENRGSVRVVSGSGFRYVVPFPYRLHTMLEEIEKAGDDSIVSWLPDGRHFQVHNPQRFMQKIIPKFFKQKSYKSFQRQLHLYGFTRVLEGKERGAYFHESFVRENRDSSLDITRIKAPKRRRMNKPDLTKKGNLQTASAARPLTVHPAGSGALAGLDVPAVADTSSSGKLHGKLVSDSSLSLPTSVATYENDHVATSVTPPPVQSIPEPREASVSNTYEWLINAGVPFSAFDPIAIESAPVASPKKCVGDLIDCADEITSLFASSRSQGPSDAASTVEAFTTDSHQISAELDAFTQLADSLIDDTPLVDPIGWSL